MIKGCNYAKSKEAKVMKEKTTEEAKVMKEKTAEEAKGCEGKVWILKVFIWVIQQENVHGIGYD